MTWLLGGFWLLLAAWGNTPFFQPHPKTNPQFDLRGYWVESAKMSQPDYEYTSLVGWPIHYLVIEKPLYRIADFFPLALLANALCVLLAVWAITNLSERYLNRFSIRSLFLFTGLVAGAIVVFPYVVPDWGILVFINGMLLLFVLPICVQLVIGFRFLMKRQSIRRDTT